jgi:hypothetical protein
LCISVCTWKLPPLARGAVQRTHVRNTNLKQFVSIAAFIVSKNAPNVAVMKGLFTHSDPITHAATKYSCNVNTRDQLKMGKDGLQPDIETSRNNKLSATTHEGQVLWQGLCRWMGTALGTSITPYIHGLDSCTPLLTQKLQDWHHCLDYIQEYERLEELSIHCRLLMSDVLSHKCQRCSIYSSN